MTVNTNHTEEHADTSLEDLEKRDPYAMPDRTMLIELVLGQREMRTLVKGVIASMDSNPMLGMMSKMFNGGKKG